MDLIFIISYTHNVIAKISLELRRSSV